ncbi:MAG: RES family NAD+ phosphorylase [Roseateles sp.]|uniref:RES family NAD+ phosphorylase n=1 Tax=Roseateles sp. TaxID=1971397 RepID=UPI0039E9D724
MASAAQEPFAWRPAWFLDCARDGMTAWRGVESQSQVATWRLVDSGAEHDTLEAMLEASKPPLPDGCEGLHYLCFTPFRYTSPYPSRFRRPGEAGVWYGAASVATVCAELAYWRHRFILDSAGLARDGNGLLTRHTLFQARIDGRALDLTAAPWSAGHAAWTHGADYRATQAVAADARAHGVEWIRYESVRHPGTHCAAVLAPRALAGGHPFDLQEWVCHATRSRVILNPLAGGTRHSWDF